MSDDDDLNVFLRLPPHPDDGSGERRAGRRHLPVGRPDREPRQPCLRPPRRRDLAGVHHLLCHQLGAGRPHLHLGPQHRDQALLHTAGTDVVYCSKMHQSPDGVLPSPHFVCFVIEVHNNRQQGGCRFILWIITLKDSTGDFLSFCYCQTKIQDVTEED